MGIEEGDPVGADLEIIPEVVLPSQVVTGARSDSDIVPEKRLMLAVLEDTIRCFQEYLQDSQHYDANAGTSDAEEWIRSRDYEWPFSFENVCDALGLDSSLLRDQLFTWKAKRRKEIEEAKQARIETPSVGGHKGPARIYRLHLRTKRTNHITKS